MIHSPPPRSTTFRGALRRLVAPLAAVQLFLAVSGPALAQQQRLPIVRDAEIEALVRDYARPILGAAGLQKSGIDIILVNDRGFNAFVVGRRMFINTGALMTAETPGEIIGVIAHEAGHIAGRHQEKLRQQLERAQTMALVATLLGVGAAVGGALSGNGGLAQGGTGIAAGGSEIARRTLLGYQRAEEIAADRSALTYLEQTGQSAAGMLKTFQRFQSALSLSGARVDPYQISHPMPRERIANLETLARQSRSFDKRDPAALQLRHDLMRAKIAAYTEGPAATSRLFRNDPLGLPARYADAINTHLRGSPANALAKIDALIREQPRNPYFHEMRGEALVRANKPAEAAKAYGQALALDPSKSAIIQVQRGQALLSVGDKASARQAVKDIRGALDRDRENAPAYRYLAQAYGMLGEIAEAELATAEASYYSGAFQDASIFAMRAQQKFKPGSPSWVRAQDIINTSKPRKKK
jgi:predicted Zn-dependent protease